MPVTILNKVADLREREELNLVVEESLDSSAIIWNVRILPAADIDNIEILTKRTPAPRGARPFVTALNHFAPRAAKAK